MGIAPAHRIALAALEAGIGVLPICLDGSKQPAVPGWKRYQCELATSAQVGKWFASGSPGLAFVTGSVSGGLIALDFDDPATFVAWRGCARRDRALDSLYATIASGYEERTPKGGRHLLFRCPEAFAQARKPGNQKLALRPVPPPQRFETLIETREEGGLIIVYPSHGRVHPTGKPYYLLRGGVTSISTLTVAERELLYGSVRAFDETPLEERRPVCPSDPPVFHPDAAVRARDKDRPGDLFNSDSTVTWEQLLAGWELVGLRPNGAGQLEGYWRHPGKVGPQHSATTNADGSNRLFCFSPSIGLPLNRYLDKFEFYAYWHWNGDLKAAARALAEQGYTTRRVYENVKR